MAKLIDPVDTVDRIFIQHPEQRGDVGEFASRHLSLINRMLKALADRGEVFTDDARNFAGALGTYISVHHFISPRVDNDALRFSVAPRNDSGLFLFADVAGTGRRLTFSIHPVGEVADVHKSEGGIPVGTTTVECAAGVKPLFRWLLGSE